MPPSEPKPLLWPALCLTVLAAALLLSGAGGRVGRLLMNTGLLTLGALAVCVPLGTLIAVVVEKTRSSLRGVFRWGLLGLLFVPLCVQTGAWQTVLGVGGWLTEAGRPAWLSGWRGTLWVHGLAGVPWVAVCAGASLRSVDRNQEEAALQDTDPWSVLWRISLRNAWPGVAAGALWVAAACATEVSVTDYFQVRTFAEEVYTQAALGALTPPPVEVLNDGGEADAGGLLEFGAALRSGDLLIGSLMLAVLFWAALTATAGLLRPLLVGLRETDELRTGWRCDARSATWFGSIAGLLIVFVAVLVPAASLWAKAGVDVQKTETGYQRGWSTAKAASLVAKSPYEHRRELWWTVAIGAGAATLAVGSAAPLAWLIRLGRAPLALASFAAAGLLALPPPLLAVWMIRLLNQPTDAPLSFLAWWYDHTVLAPVLVQAARAFPLALALVGLAFATVSTDIVSAARSDGAGWWSTLLRIAVPMRRSALAAAWLLSLVLACGEVAATLLVAPPGVATLAMRVFSLLHYGAEDRVAALCLALAIGVALLAAVAGRLWKPGGARVPPPRLG